MKFSMGTDANPIDQARVVGRALDRIDGPLKTAGLATYAYEQHGAVPDQAYGYVAGAGIAKGRIRSIDVAAAGAMPGVIAVVTAENAGALGMGAFYVAPALAGPEVRHYHQAVAIVVAESFEQARAAAVQLHVEYDEVPGAYDLAASRPGGVVPTGLADTEDGDFDAAFASAEIRIDGTYTTPDQSHAMLEPHATLAAWEGGRLTLWTSVQIMSWARRDLALILGMAQDDIRLLSPFIGGGFGGKVSILCDAVLAAVAARVAGRPVRVALPRALMFNNTTHRPATIQRIRIGAGRDGRITAIGHESWSGNLPGGIPERSTVPTEALYAGANRMLRTRLSVLDLPEGSAMRAPGETPGLMALEIAVDELAERTGIDPVALRILNDTQVEPGGAGRPFSTRRLVDCLRTGAERFGWDRRNPRCGQVRDGAWLVGMGVAAGIRADNVSDSGARVRLDAEGIVTVETDMTDMGTGSYTVLGQTAAEMMGVPLDRVVVRLGDSSFPETPGGRGQRGTNSAASGVYAACVRLREAAAQALGFNTAEVEFRDGEVRAGNRRVRLGQAAQAGELVAEDRIEFGPDRERVAHQTFGAQFCEVGVDARTGEVRVRRMLAVCAAGRLLNPKMARSQVIGAMTMGLGGALMEEMAVDKGRGFFVNHDLAGYEVPVHADIPYQDVVFIDELDPTSSPMKAKGVGELGICGVGAAIANAVHNATGIRVRDYPITLDKLIDRLPPLA